ncbi:RNA-binding protein MEX3A [Anthophora quadrimaculata]
MKPRRIAAGRRKVDVVNGEERRGWPSAKEGKGEEWFTCIASIAPAQGQRVCETEDQTGIAFLACSINQKEIPAHFTELASRKIVFKRSFSVLIAGCKIKALRAKTNTYIKTPVRGEEPVFVVTGRKEDVARAKREILSAAEHFSQIRASRKSSLGALLGAPPGPPASVPGHVTIQVRVPYRVVGLVVGPKGATIKRIQHQTHTYIVTPSRDKEPVFEVTGLPDSVEAARREIEAHIALRTGTGTNLDESELLSVLYRGGLSSILGCLDPPGLNGSNGSSGAFSSSGSCSSSSSSSGAPGLNDLVAIWGAGMERDEGLGESPSFESQTASASSIWSFPGVALPSRPSPPASASPTSPTDSLLGGGRRECVVCGDKEVTAALVPCGHNHFCLDCGNRVCESSDPSCPVCSRPVLQALRIFS